MRIFKIGDMVKIKRSSEFYGQSKEIGEIIEIDTDMVEITNVWYVVRFNNYTNSYKDEDLEDVDQYDDNKKIRRNKNGKRTP